METQEMYNKGQSLNSKHGINNCRIESARYTSRRNQDRSHILRIQYNQPNPVSDNYYRRPRRNNHGVERENGISNARRSMSDSQITSTKRSLESKSATSPRRNDQQHSGN
jgi:hypothetical protein